MAIKQCLCVTDCWWKGRRYRADSFYDFPETVELTKHFVAVGGDKREKVEAAIKKYVAELKELQKDKKPHPATLNKIDALKRKIGVLKKSIGMKDEEEGKPKEAGE